MRFCKSRAIVMLAGVAGLLVAPERARCDAIMVTRAMTATTIAEIFIADDSIRVELEIGVADLAGFRNLMPDQIYERLGYEPESFVTRLGRFLGEDWTITLSDGTLLAGRVAALEARPRVVRDEVTGERLPAMEKEPEPVVFAVLVYDMPGRPASLIFKPPQGDDARFVSANIGFVVYHMGLPVTDFRYLGGRETVVLDWDDPWYSRFENKNLKRRFDAPLSAFLYVENYEVRKEIIARPKDLQNWVDLGLAGKDTIRVGEQEELKARVAEFFATRSEVTIDGRVQEPTLDRINFVRRSLRRTGIVDPPEDLPVTSATLGVIYVYPVDSLPDAVSMNWELFSDRIQRVPTSATDEAGGLPYFLTPGDSVLLWQNFLTNPTVPRLEAISTPYHGLPVPVVSALSVVALAALLVVSAAGKTLRRRRTLIVAIALVAVAVALWPVARVAVPIPGLSGMSQAETESVVNGLLTNVYRAFDYRDESDIYDTLDRSASGDLLTRVYLETRKALELQSQGGARVKVKGVDMSSVVAEPLDGERGFTARCTWTVSGSVGHWGHLHTRVNQYDALLTIQDVGGVWKITGLDLVEEKRVS
jgi:hypothetical protein